jgi:hypothetical protein
MRKIKVKINERKGIYEIELFQKTEDKGYRFLWGEDFEQSEEALENLTSKIYWYLTHA